MPTRLGVFQDNQYVAVRLNSTPLGGTRCICTNIASIETTTVIRRRWTYQLKPVRQAPFFFNASKFSAFRYVPAGRMKLGVVVDGQAILIPRSRAQTMALLRLWTPILLYNVAT